jgi:branched-chain amino acid transport system permease protein
MTRPTLRLSALAARSWPFVLVIVAFAFLPNLSSGVFSGAIRQILTTAFLFAFAAFAWNVLSGYLGYLSLGDYLYFGLSAYVCAYLLTAFGISPLFSVVPCALAAGALAWTLGRLVAGLRFRGSIFALVTLAVAEIGRVAITRIPAFKGEAGIYLSLANEPANFLFTNPLAYYYAGLGLVAAGGLLSFVAYHSNWGLQLRALRDEEIAARSLGVRIDARLSQAAALSAAAFAIAGAFYACSSFFVTPGTVLNIDIIVTVLIMCVVGGLGRVWAPLYGMLVLAAVQIALNKAGLSSTTAATWGHVAYGVIIILAVAGSATLGDADNRLTRMLTISKPRPPRAQASVTEP